GPVAGDREAPELGQIRLEREAIDGLDRVVLGDRREALLRQLLEVLMARRDADVVEAVVRPERVRAAHLVTAVAARLAVEQREAGARVGADGVDVPAQEAIERRGDE